MISVECRPQRYDNTFISAHSIDSTQLENEYMVIKIQLSTTEKTIYTYALIDCGATAFAFIDHDFVKKHHFSALALTRPRSLHLADGTDPKSGKLCQYADLNMSIQTHQERLEFLITKLGHYPVILGIPWLQKHDVTTKWASNLAILNSPFCRKNCLREDQQTVIARGLVNVPEAPHLDDLGKKDGPIPEEFPKNTEASNDCCMIGAAPFHRLSSKKEHRLCSISMRDIDLALAPKPVIDPAEKLPKHYHAYLDIFSKKQSDTLPPHRVYDHEIQIEEGKHPPFGPLRGMSQDELKVMKKFLEDNLSKGFIRASSSPAAAPVLFVKKPGGGLRFCVDYRALNEITRKNRYPLPLIKETLDRLCHAKYFTKIDIMAAFNKIRMKEGEEWKTAFRTRYGLFESLVLPFGLCNGPATFQHFMNDTLREYLDVFCTAYIDDILIYSSTLNEHRSHVMKILQRLRDAGIQADIAKCEFEVDEVAYLGLLVGRRGVRMDPAKVAAIREWATPANVKDVQGFLGFANFYRRFIRGFSTVTQPLTELTKKNVTWNWTEICTDAFELLKDLFTTAPILALFDPDKESIIETDASDHVSAGVHSQLDNAGVLRPVAFFSKKHSPAEVNYEIYDKELLAVILAFQEWRQELEGARHPITVYSDHKNLQYFMTTKNLNRRQARWAEYLSRFDFKIHFRPGKQGEKPDALTRRSGDLPSEGDLRLEQQQQSLLKPHQLSPNVQLAICSTRSTDRAGINLRERNAQENDISYQESNAEDNGTPARSVTNNHENAITAPQAAESHNVDENGLEEEEEGGGEGEETEVVELIRQGYEIDAFAGHIIGALLRGERHSKLITLAECEVRADRLYYKGSLYIPDFQELRRRIIKLHHDTLLAGHGGKARTLDLIKRTYFWPKMRKTVEQYVRNCHTCSRSKSSRSGPYGVLKSLPVPSGRWKDISMDFVTGLPESNGFDAILVVVDRLTKMRHFIPTNTTIGAIGTADLLMRHIYKLHGLPDTIVSDRGPQFAADAQRQICRVLGIQRLLSTAFHPQTDGQTEIANAAMECYLRAFVSYQQDDWEPKLPFAEFAANNALSDTLHCSPFFANYGFNPRMGTEIRTRVNHASTAAEIRADDFARSMQDLLDILQEEMKFAQARYEDNADAHRTPAPRFAVGDLVWLDARDIRTQRPARKLDYKNIGRFRVSHVISPYAYRLELPATMKIYDVFHVSKLSPAATDPLPGQIAAPSPPVIVDGEATYEVEQILDSKSLRGGRIQYLVKWANYDLPTWEPPEFVDNADEALQTFHRLYPHKPDGRQ